MSYQQPCLAHFRLTVLRVQCISTSTAISTDFMNTTQNYINTELTKSQWQDNSDIITMNK